MAIYMKYDGIEGNVTAEGFEKQIQLNSVSLAVNRGISMGTGNVANRENRAPELSTLDATLNFSKHSTAMFSEATVGDTGTKVLISFCQTSKDKQVAYLTYELESALISHYSIAGDGVEEPVEHISISYESLLMSYADHTADNKLGGQQRASYSVKKGKS